MRYQFLVGTVIALFASLFGSVLLANTLVLGSVNDNIRKHLDRFAPLVAYLETELAPYGIDNIEVSVLPTSAAMTQALRNGDVDLYFDSPLVAGLVARNSGSVPFLRRWKRGVATYHSVIIVKTDSEYSELSDLLGARIGFQEPDSTSGFLLPAGLLRSEGHMLRELESHEEVPSEQEIGYLFTGDDKNTLTWLLKGRIEAGATDPNGFETLKKARPGEFREIARSITVPRQVVVRRGDMDPDLLIAITSILSSMHETERGREVMQKFHKTTRFDPFPEGLDATFGEIYRVLDQLEALGVL